MVDDNLTLPGDPKERPISVTHLSKIMDDDPKGFKSIAKYCVLAIAGTSDSVKDISRGLLASLMEGRVDLAATKEYHRVDLYMDPSLGVWTYVASYYDYYSPILDKKGNLNFVPKN